MLLRRATGSVAGGTGGESRTTLKARIQLRAFVTRGPDVGTVLFPHKHEDGKYVVSKTRFKRDYKRISEKEILAHLENGHSLRMSNPNEGVSPTSLISPKSIFRPVKV
jgi:hypothetical protein